MQDLNTHPVYTRQDLSIQKITHYTNEVAISYDSTYTKVSCDSTGSFFDLYLDGLQPERYYRIEIKTTIGATVLIVDTEEFKISNK